MSTAENPPLASETQAGPPTAQPNQASPMIAGRVSPPPAQERPREGEAGPKELDELEEEDGPLLTVEAVLNLLEELKVPIFCDQYGYAYAYAHVPCWEPEQHSESVPLKSKRFRNRLKALVQAAFDKTMSASMLKACVKELEVVAEGTPPVTLHNRMGLTDDGIRIDLGDDAWRSIQVMTNGYRVMSDDKPFFYRANHQMPLPEPVSGGDPMELLQFVPVEDKSDELLLLTWLTVAFHPAMTVPMLLFTGQQGSAKTTRCKRIRSLVDPSKIPVLGEASDRELLQVFYHHAVPCFENVSYFNRKQEDIFCRAVAGNGVERRKLFTDTDAVIFYYRRPILLNAIDIPSHRPDFLDRCLVLSCKRLELFRPAEELDALFEQARPRLLGSILDLLVKTLNVIDRVPSTSNEFRMADFARFGRAVAVALGRTPEDFDATYRSNLAQQSRELVDDSSFARAIIIFAQGYTEQMPWKGTAEELLKKVTKVAKANNLPTSGELWPGSARWASTRLSELTPALASEGAIVKRLPRENKCRPWLAYAQ